MSGKDKGKTGTIYQVIPAENKVVIDGIGMKKRHVKGTNGKVGQIVEAPRAIDASNVMYYDADSKKGTRIGREYRDGTLVRVTKKGAKVLS